MSERTAPPDVAYEPPAVETDLQIAMIGCGGVAGSHLAAHRAAGRDVVAFCDIDAEAATARRDEYNPDAEVYTDYREVLARDDVDVVDVPVHPEPRETILEDALEAGKHVFSEKPFVVDLSVGERLVELADENHLTLAVNMSKRWGPVNSYVRNAVDAGSIGDPMAALVVGRRNKDPAPPIKEESEYWLLADFGVHYIDFVRCLFGDREPERVYASTRRTAIQESEIPLIAQIAIDYPDVQGTIRFDDNTPVGGEDTNYVVGTGGTVQSKRRGPGEPEVVLENADGRFSPDLDTSINGHGGSFAEFLAAIEKDREPFNSGRDNLRTMELMFAAVASADDGEPKVPGEVRRLPENTIREDLFIE